MFEALLPNIFKISAIMGIVILVLLALSPLLKKKYAAKWRYWVWMIVAVRLLLPWSLSLPQAPVQFAIPQMSLTTPITPSQYPPAAPSVEGQGQSAVPETPSEPVGQEVSLLQMAAIIWTAGFLLFLLHQLIAYRLFRKRALHRGNVVHDGRIPEILARLCREMGIRRQIKIIAGHNIGGPMMIGFIRPHLLFPHTEYTDKALHYILKHELTHLKRHDLWYKLLLLLAKAMHWFNPLVWLMFHQAGQDLELSCDDEVTQGASFQERKEYSKTILASIHYRQSGKTALSTYFYGSKNTMKERFQNILNMGIKRRGTLALCMVLILVGAAGAFVACHQANPPAAVTPDGTDNIDTGEQSGINGNTEPPVQSNSNENTEPPQRNSPNESTEPPERNSSNESTEPPERDSSNENTELRERNNNMKEYPKTKDIVYESEGGQYTEPFTLLNNSSLPFVTYIPNQGWSATQTGAGVRIDHNGYIEISFLQDDMDQQEAEAVFERVLGDVSKFEKREENLPGWAISSLYLWENNSMTWATLGLHSGQYFYIYTHYPDSIEGDSPLIQSIFNEWRWKDTGEALGYSLQ